LAAFVLYKGLVQQSGMLRHVGTFARISRHFLRFFFVCSFFLPLRELKIIPRSAVADTTGADVAQQERSKKFGEPKIRGSWLFFFVT
jgi:hypothetical protein